MKKNLWILACFALSARGFSGEETVYLYKAGAFEVYTLVENRGPGRSQILVGASDALKKRYLPADFQSEVNAFLIKGRGKIVLVDTGFGGAVFENMRKLGVEPKDVDAVLLTHLHGDHIGGLARDGKPLFPRALVYVAALERDYWTRININAAADAALKPYGNRLRVFTPGELGSTLTELLPGISAIAAYGHTPGHTVFLVSGEGGDLLIWGDLTHVQDIQFPRPDISVTYDVDPVMAAETRKKILEYAVKNRIPIAGMHLVYPAIGTVTAAGQGYTWNPAK
ncbi:MAG: MBL fold metallo-hydrolase [Treponema sp.]|nr:MBL fold metallo-hydrolase [Treponema sp.]